MRFKRILAGFLAGATAVAGLSLTAFAEDTESFFEEEAEAFQSTKTIDQAFDWLWSVKDKTVGSGQCVALTNAYLAELGIGRISGNADTYANEDRTDLPGGVTRIKDAQPIKGDILIYLGGDYGHVAIYEEEDITWHQNFPYYGAGDPDNKQYVTRVEKTFKNKKGNDVPAGYKNSTLFGTYWGVIRPEFKGGGASGGISGSIAIDEEHFPDKNFRAYISEGIDIDKNGVLDAEEREMVGAIHVYDRNISSLSGIEYFPKLMYLNCGANQLTSLDISKNTALTELMCWDNQLTSLDVSKNTALTVLYCDQNQLTSLDLSKNTALEKFSCAVNQLTSLDLSKNTALTNLDCRSNQFTSLDLSNNTRLEELNCSWNQLTSLDLSKNTALTYLDCEYNQLTSLDLSKNLALSSGFLDIKTDKTITIYGIVGSSAETYAKRENIKFIDVGAPAPSQPATVKSSANMLGATVMCSKVDGATKYRLFYTTDNGKNYTKVGDNKTRKWEVTGLKAGVEYKFLVLAYNGEKWSAYKKGDCFAAVTPSPTVKATAGKAKAVVTCSTVSGAKKYRLFYTTDNGKSYKKVGDNTTRKWTVTGLKSGTTYKFLVLAYDGKKWSAYKKGDCYAPVIPK